MTMRDIIKGLSEKTLSLDDIDTSEYDIEMSGDGSVRYKKKTGKRWNIYRPDKTPVQEKIPEPTPSIIPEPAPPSIIPEQKETTVSRPKKIPKTEEDYYNKYVTKETARQRAKQDVRKRIIDEEVVPVKTPPNPSVPSQPVQTPSVTSQPEIDPESIAMVNYFRELRKNIYG